MPYWLGGRKFSRQNHPQPPTTNHNSSLCVHDTKHSPPLGTRGNFISATSSYSPQSSNHNMQLESTKTLVPILFPAGNTPKSTWLNLQTFAASHICILPHQHVFQQQHTLSRHEFQPPNISV